MENSEKKVVSPQVPSVHLLIDIGNTKIALALVHGEVWEKKCQFPTPKGQDFSNLSQLIAQHLQFDLGQMATENMSVWVACVVPELKPPLARIFPQAHFVGHQDIQAFTLEISQPHTLGPDRIADAEAAVREHGFPVAIVDLGTATTISIVNREGAFLGGTIAAGFGTARDALLENAAALNLPLFEPSPNAWGSNTAEAIVIGTAQGHVDAIHLRLKKIEAALGYPCKKVVTGGALAELKSFFQKDDVNFIFDPDLALKGLLYLSRRAMT